MPTLKKRSSKAAFRASLVALLLASMLQFLGRRYPQFYPDLIDGLRGLFLGVFIASVFLIIGRNGGSIVKGR